VESPLVMLHAQRTQTFPIYEDSISSHAPSIIPAQFPSFRFMVEVRALKLGALSLIGGIITLNVGLLVKNLWYFFNL
jgi:hypothetical protein